MSLVGQGISDRAIATETGVGYWTARRWRVAVAPPQAVLRRRTADAWSVPDDAVYIATCWASISVMEPLASSRRMGGAFGSLPIVDTSRSRRRSSRRWKRRSLADMLGFERGWAKARSSASPTPAIPRAFPQHGPGRKHDRAIALADWQLALTHANPAALIRGLIHSDGCRTVNRFRTKLPSGRTPEYSYVRYFFSNLSEDVRRIFAEHCELLGVRVTQSNHRNLSVSHPCQRGRPRGHRRPEGLGPVLLMPRPRSIDDVRAVFALKASGLTDREISAATGVPAHTIRTWRNHGLSQHAATRRPLEAHGGQDRAGESGIELGSGHERGEDFDRLECGRRDLNPQGR